jgi:RNA polymerase sigma-70 factor (ECF subfamily)
MLRRGRTSLNEQLNKIKEGNKEAMGSLLKELEPKISRIISYKISNEQDVKDLTQEVLVRIYRHIHKHDESSAKLMTWVNHIAKNICIDYYRRKNIKQVVLIGDDKIVIPSNERIDHYIEKKEFSTQLTQALGTLTEAQRKAFVMRHLQDKSCDEISKSMSLPLNTIKSHIHRAKHLLRGILCEYKMAS